MIMHNAQKRNVSQSRFKHMKTKHHYIRMMIFYGWCKLVNIPTKMNTAHMDMATKIRGNKNSATKFYQQKFVKLDWIFIK
jgi:hypothetical protein